MSNQTDEQWVANISDAELGTGIFVFPKKQVNTFGSSDFEQVLHSKLRGTLTKTLRQKINYLNCVRVGSADWMIAFKWVPQSIADYDQVQATASDCGNVECAGRCAKYACVCIDGECR